MSELQPSSSVGSAVSETRRRSSRVPKPKMKEFSPEPFNRKVSMATHSQHRQSRKSETPQEERQSSMVAESLIQNFRNFWKDSISTLSNLTATSFDLKDYLPSERRKPGPSGTQLEKSKKQRSVSKPAVEKEPPFPVTSSLIGTPPAVTSFPNEISTTSKPSRDMTALSIPTKSSEVSSSQAKPAVDLLISQTFKSIEAPKKSSVISKESQHKTQARSHPSTIETEPIATKISRSQEVMTKGEYASSRVTRSTSNASSEKTDSTASIATTTTIQPRGDLPLAVTREPRNKSKSVGELLSETKMTRRSTKTTPVRTPQSGNTIITPAIETQEAIRSVQTPTGSVSSRTTRARSGTTLPVESVSTRIRSRSASEEFNREDLVQTREIRATSEIPITITEIPKNLTDDEVPWSTKIQDVRNTSFGSNISIDSSLPEKVSITPFVTTAETENPHLETIKVKSTPPKSVRKLAPLMLPTRCTTRERKPIRTSDFVYDTPRRSSLLTSTPLKTPTTAPASIAKKLEGLTTETSPIEKRGRKSKKSDEDEGSFFMAEYQRRKARENKAKETTDLKTVSIVSTTSILNDDVEISQEIQDTMQPIQENLELSAINRTSTVSKRDSDTHFTEQSSSSTRASAKITAKAIEPKIAVSRFPRSIIIPTKRKSMHETDERSNELPAKEVTTDEMIKEAVPQPIQPIQGKEPEFTKDTGGDILDKEQKHPRKLRISLKRKPDILESETPKLIVSQLEDRNEVIRNLMDELLDRLSMPYAIVAVEEISEETPEGAESDKSSSGAIIDDVQKTATRAKYQRKTFSQSAISAIEPMTTRSMSFKAESVRRPSISSTSSELRPRSTTLPAASPTPLNMPRVEDITPAISHSLIHGREPRNKSKPLSELAPALMKQEKRKIFAESAPVSKRRRITETQSEELRPPTEPLHVDIPSTSTRMPDIGGLLAANTEILLQSIQPSFNSLSPFPALSSTPVTPVVTDVHIPRQSEESFRKYVLTSPLMSLAMPPPPPSFDAPPPFISELPPDYVPNFSVDTSSQSKGPTRFGRPLSKQQRKFSQLSEKSESMIDETPSQAEAPRNERYSAYGVVEARQNVDLMSVFDRMENRAKVHPLAMGVVPRKQDDYPRDFFYREILMNRQQDEISFRNPEAEVDVDGEDEIIGDEIMTTNPADKCANDIVEILPRPIAETLDEEPHEFTLEELMEKAKQEGVESIEHIEVIAKWIAQQRSTDSASIGIIGGCSIFYTNTLKNANRMREEMKLYSPKLMELIVEAHTWLLTRLATPLLASYLNLLRFLKLAGSSLPSLLTKEEENGDEKIKEANAKAREFISTKIQDPMSKTVKENLDMEKRIEASILFVSPKFVTPNYEPKKRAHEAISQLLPSCVRVFEQLKLDFGDLKEKKDTINVQTLAHMSIAQIKRKIKELIKRRPEDHIFLAGWGTTCLLNHAVLQEARGVSGVLNFAFPVTTIYGKRGDVEDQHLLHTYCPTLFIVGEHATDCDLKALQKLRENMIHETGAIVVGSANSNLYVNAMRLTVERVSQKCVIRSILEHVVDFMQKAINVSPNLLDHRRALKPISTPNMNEVDMSLVKQSRGEKEKSIGDSSKTTGVTTSSQIEKHTKKEKDKIKKNEDAKLQERLRMNAIEAEPIAPKKPAPLQKMRASMNPDDLRKTLSKSSSGQSTNIQQHRLQSMTPNPKKQEEFLNIFGPPIPLTPRSQARVTFNNKLSQTVSINQMIQSRAMSFSSSQSAPSTSTSTQLPPISTFSQMNRSAPYSHTPIDEQLQEEEMALAAIQAFQVPTVEGMDYEDQ